jgi:hypothetical protein
MSGTDSIIKQGVLGRSFWCFCVTIVATLMLAFSCASHKTAPPRFTSYSNLYNIGIAVSRYKYDHQELPRGWSDLVPEYVPFERIWVFYVTNEYVAHPSKPSDWASNASLLNKFSSYTYLGTNGTNGVIAFEKFDLWKPNNPLDGKLAVLFGDLHVEYVPTMKLQELLSGKMPMESGANAGGVVHSP